LTRASTYATLRRTHVDARERTSTCVNARRCSCPHQLSVC